MNALDPGWQPITCRILWAPKGLNRIDASRGGRRHVLVDEPAFEDVLRDFKFCGKGAWLDVNHQRGICAGEVLGLTWDEDFGIVIEVRWSAAGEAAIRGGDWRFFSPAFNHDEATLRPLGFLNGTDAGGLVNAPAFKAMPRIVLPSRGGEVISQ